jgi:uncharacterized protein (TIGR02271 family)/MYXO-CTERM domain-containing protein
VLARAEQGVHGTIDTTAWPLDGSRAEVLVSLEDGQEVLVPLKALIRQEEGRYYVPMVLADLERGRRVGTDPREPPLVLPVIEEALDVQTRTVETARVRIRKIVHDHEELVDPPLWRDEVVIERVPINRVVEGPIPVRYEGETMIVSLLEEVLVVETRLLLREELHLTTRRTDTHQPARVTLRRENVSVERVDPERNEPNSQIAVVPPSVALAAQAPAGQTVQAPPVTRTETREDDNSGKWGLLGLLGLAGLAGLLRRDRARSVTVADRPDRR